MNATTQDVSSNEIADYLSDLDRTTAIPVLVRIGRKTYPGAYYTQERDVAPGCRAYVEGHRTYRQTMLYLVGDLPASYRRSSNVAYRFEGAARRWHVAGWYAKKEGNDYHPFGPMFQLAPDTHGVTVNEEGDPYPVVPMILERY